MAVEGARAYHDANQEIGDDDWITLALNSERFDTDTIHDLSTNNERLTCQTAGVYLVVGLVSWAANATGNRGVRIVKNGSDVIAEDYHQALASGGFIQGVKCIQQMEVGDYVTLVVKQDSGGALDVTGSNAFSPEFMMQRLADLPVEPAGGGGTPAPLLVMQGQI